MQKRTSEDCEKIKMYYKEVLFLLIGVICCKAFVLAETLFTPFWSSNEAIYHDELLGAPRIENDFIRPPSEALLEKKISISNDERRSQILGDHLNQYTFGSIF